MLAATDIEWGYQTLSPFYYQEGVSTGVFRTGFSCDQINFDLLGVQVTRILRPQSNDKNALNSSIACKTSARMCVKDHERILFAFVGNPSFHI